MTWSWECGKELIIIIGRQSVNACSEPSERRWCGGVDDEDLIMGCSLRPHAVGRLRGGGVGVKMMKI